MTDKKKPLIGLIHSTRFVVQPVHDVVASQCPNADIINIVDEGILRVLFELGEINQRIIDWLGRMVDSAVGTGVDMAVMSCSSLSPAVNPVKEMVSIPLIKIDAPMAEQAVLKADRIGLVAQRLGKNPVIVPRVQADAFLKLNQGDIDGHDDVVIQAVKELLDEVDVVLLAQISIARVTAKMDAETRKRVYSSLDFIAPKINEILSGKNQILDS